MYGLWVHNMDMDLAGQSAGDAGDAGRREAGVGQASAHLHVIV